jgi:ketosteroid isomerase-like protein
MSTITPLADEVGKLNRQWMQAYVTRDAGFLERHLSEDYVSTFPDGQVLDKKGEIEAMKSGMVTISEMRPTEMNVRIYGNVAVITGQSTITATVSGQEASGNYRFTDVWAKGDSHWQAVASQVTRMTKS